MDDSVKSLLEIIRFSQFENGEYVHECVDIDAVIEEARYQSVNGLVASVIPETRMPEAQKNSRDIQIASCIRYLHEEKQLKVLMDNAMIPFVILKGSAAAIYYKDPFFRNMGDIDFIVDPCDFIKAREVLINNGYTLTHDTDGESRHISFRKNNIAYELHRRFSYIDMDIESYVMEGIQLRENAMIMGYEFPMLPKLANGLVLLSHMRNHLKSGLGLRQVIDWMMFVNAELDDDFWNKSFGLVAREKGMDTLAKVTTKMCQLYLGLDDTIEWCASADEYICENLMELILSSGNFGKKHGNGKNVQAVTTAFFREGFFYRLQRVGESNWKAYKKHHWLKPFCWIYQFFRYIKQGFRIKRNSLQLRDDAKKGKERYNLLKKLGIE